jgi:hypothetical protein
MSRAAAADFRLVGYASTRAAARVRIYVPAQRALSATSAVLVQPAPGHFDFAGRPLGLQPASSRLAARVRAHLLGRPVSRRLADIPFQPVSYHGDPAGSQQR